MIIIYYQYKSIQKMHKCTVQQFSNLDLNAVQNNHRTITINFSQQNLQNLVIKLPQIASKIHDKPLTKCYLIPDQQSIPSHPKYDAVLLGGTFDYFHLGHQLLLLTALYHASKRILVGVTSDAMLVKKKNKQIIQPLQVRMEQVKNYIRMIKPDIQIIVAELIDPYGPAIYTKDYQAIIVSEQTKIGAIKINQIRQSTNLYLLSVQQCPLLIEDQSHRKDKQNVKVEDKISSSHIRQHILLKNKMELGQFTMYRESWNKMCKNICEIIPQKPQNKQFQTKIQQHIESWFNKLLQQYSQYWRHYHTNRHIFEMLQQYKHLDQSDVQKLGKIGRLAVELGIWFHDAEYWIGRKDNQEISAKLAVEFIRGFSQIQLGQLEELAKKVQQAILATKNHKTDNFETQILIDLDMSILDSDHKKYVEYAESIKREYCPVVKDQFNKKRIQFLKTLNPKDVFYHRKANKIEENIKWEIQMLEKQNYIKNQKFDKQKEQTQKQKQKQKQKEEL